MVLSENPQRYRAHAVSVIEPLEARQLFSAIPHFDHVVVVIEAKHAYDAIIGIDTIPYINSLAQNGALFTQSFGVTAAAQPNYLALFSGSTQGLTGEGVRPKFAGPDLYSNLASVGDTFAGYFQGMPVDGYDGASFGDYVRKHNPVTQFSDVPQSANRIFNAINFPTAADTDYSFLPTVSFVVPDVQNNMDSCRRTSARTRSGPRRTTAC
jgi:phosphatidylinositol-3-phosphatase